jgi:hypothetical protein
MYKSEWIETSYAISYKEGTSGSQDKAFAGIPATTLGITLKTEQINIQP